MQKHIVRWIAICTSAAMASPAGAAGRATAIAAAFSDYCLSPSADFASLDLRASEAHYEVLADVTSPTGDGGSGRQKRWRVSAPSGDFVLNAADVSMRDMHVTSCGISAAEAVGPDMERALSADPRMGRPAGRFDPSTDGGVRVVWRVANGKSSTNEPIKAFLVYNDPGQVGVEVGLNRIANARR